MRLAISIVAYAALAALSNLSKAATKRAQEVKPTHAAPTPEASRSWRAIVKDAGSGWLDHKAGQLGAALAYYSIFSVGPLLVVALAVAGLVYDQSAARTALTAQLAGLLGTEAAEGIESMLSAADKPAEGIFATLLGLAALIFGAIGVVMQLKDALNTVFEFKNPPSAGWWGFVRTYAVSFAGVVSVGFLLLVSLVVSTILAAAGAYIEGAAPEIFLQVATFVVSLAVTSAMFAAMFRWLPDADIAWRHILPGAVLTAALFELGRFLISFYIGKQGLESTYGAAASLVVMLIWVYYSSQIVLFGAEFVRALAWQAPEGKS